MNAFLIFVRAKLERAQTLYHLGCIDFDVMKVGELAVLIALELTTMVRYGGQMPKKRRNFATLLKHILDADGLTDARPPVVVRNGGTAIGVVNGKMEPSLSHRRNSTAHGYTFDGLLELVRNLINYAYRDFIANTPAWRMQAPSD